MPYEPAQTAHHVGDCLRSRGWQHGLFWRIDLGVLPAEDQQRDLLLENTTEHIDAITDDTYEPTTSDDDPRNDQLEVPHKDAESLHIGQTR